MPVEAYSPQTVTKTMTNNLSSAGAVADRGTRRDRPTDTGAGRRQLGLLVRSNNKLPVDSGN